MEEKCLKIYHDRSIFIDNEGNEFIYEEGSMSEASKKNYEKIKNKFEKEG